MTEYVYKLYGTITCIFLLLHVSYYVHYKYEISIFITVLREIMTVVAIPGSNG